MIHGFEKEINSYNVYMSPKPKTTIGDVGRTQSPFPSLDRHALPDDITALLPLPLLLARVIVFGIIVIILRRQRARLPLLPSVAPSSLSSPA